MTDAYYQYHVFFCTNQRPNGEPCCQNHHSSEMRDYMKQRTKELGLVRSGKVRVNTSGCMNRCALGPVVVIYPEGVWYTWKTQADIDEIIGEHLQQGRIVERLRLKK